MRRTTYTLPTGGITPRRVLACALLAAALTLAACGDDDDDSEETVAETVATEAAATEGGGALLLIMDASGSMREELPEGGTRLEAAKEGLRGVVASLPEETEVGLRVLGGAQGSSCDATELIAPVTPLDPEGLNAAIDGFDAGGETPIGRSLEAAGTDLPAEGGRTIVLVSDGEDTCTPPDPCEMAEDLKAQGIDVVIETVGFALGGNEAARTQLTCIAEATGGEFHDVADAEELGETLGEVAGGPLAQCPAAAALGDDGEWAGGWDDSRYWAEGYVDMILGQSGDRVEGCFSVSGHTYEQLLITGTVSGQTLSGRWGSRSFEEAEAGEPSEDGDFEFTLSEDGNSFTGRIEFDEDPDRSEEWNGTRCDGCPPA